MEVGPELVREGVGCGVAKLGGGGVEGSDGGGCVVGFEEEAVGRTEAQAVGIVTEAEADVEAVVQELLQLLGLAAEAVPDPRLRGTALQAQDIVEGTDTMEDNRTTELFTQRNLCLESGQLEVIRCGANAVETAFADEKKRLSPLPVRPRLRS